MFAAREGGNQRPSPYATRGMFCRIFERDMGRLYLLSYLLTADETVAERCFIEGLHIAQEANAIFEEWAEAWARRTIVLNAVRMISPRLIAETSESFRRVAGDAAKERPEVSAILKLPTFERFAFVMSVLEGYSDHECALHLACQRADITAARSRALSRMEWSAELHRAPGGIVSDQKGRESVPNLESSCMQRDEVVISIHPCPTKLTRC
jgi:DNA-directed RNA polymerase specialized sigma24 family protein